MKPITVVIPTARQPVFLESALRSIARQTVVHEIEEIIVSENLGDLSSKAVCERFQLPIRYILQEPPLTPVGNFQFVIGSARTELIAYLCDDDWWAPGHLQSALEAMRSNEKAAAWFSACFYSISEAPPRGWIGRHAALWLAAGSPSPMDTWILAPLQVLAATWILSPFHFSSMVLRRDPARAALSVMSKAHHYQVDRVYVTELSAAGHLLFEPFPDTFVRWREENLTLRTKPKERDALFRECTKDIWDESVRRRVDVASAWHEYLRNADQDVVSEVGKAFRKAMDKQTLRAHGFDGFILPNRYLHFLQRAARFGKSMIMSRLRRLVPRLHAGQSAG
jgi:glycosyltransferase involved in cell wall biosynthesis